MDSHLIYVLDHDPSKEVPQRTMELSYCKIPWSGDMATKQVQIFPRPQGPVTILQKEDFGAQDIYHFTQEMAEKCTCKICSHL
jgi:hypothetical protein